MKWPPSSTEVGDDRSLAATTPAADESSELTSHSSANDLGRSDPRRCRVPCNAARLVALVAECGWREAYVSSSRISRSASVLAGRLYQRSEVSSMKASIASLPMKAASMRDTLTTSPD